MTGRKVAVRQTTETEGIEYLLSDKAYKVLKWVGLVACPALAVLYGTLGAAWGWPATEQVVITINSLGVAVGALIGISQGSSKTITTTKTTEED